MWYHMTCQLVQVIIINVIDVNDNDPQFEPVTMPVIISETAVQGTGVVTLTATDDDVGTNANVTISIFSVTPYITTNG